MFPATLTPFQRTGLLIGLLLWAVLLFGGFVFGRPDPANTRRMPTSTRLLSSAVLVLAGWSWYALARETAATRYTLAVALGMSFGLLGDIAMAGLLPLSNRVIGGIVAFGVGHLCYIAAFLGLGGQAGLTGSSRWPLLAVWLALGVVGWYVVVQRGQPFSALRTAALVYALLLATTAGLAAGLAWQARPFVPLALGAGLFFLSDLILAGQLFGGLSFPLIGDVIWLTYGPGQMLIVFSGAAAMRLTGA
ncbi:MAG: lysoplasmalogenase [Anaerolineae bacterium]|nr:lysoplasmalogenase [Caldilineales bacterium]MDW8270483.1 lysoplasmalogenase [Anaerolineae bacterium]